MKNYWDELIEKDYSDYVDAQTELNKAKINCQWVKDFEVKIMVDYLKKHNKNIIRGVCHGSRNGFEVETFRKYLGIEVFGTDISETAKNFPNMIQWDMHEVKEKWLGKFDFIYSNSFDHTYDLNKLLKSWTSCLNQNGVIIMHFSSGHFEDGRDRFTPGDCFTATKEEYKKIISKYGEIIDRLESKDSRFMWVIKGK